MSGPVEDGPTANGAVVGGPSCRHVVVAVPARNEEASIRACVESIDRAASRVSASVVIAIAADSCTDGTVERAATARRRRARMVVVEGEWGRAGAARAAAVGRALADLDPAQPCWIANTDADCRVPDDWLALQLRRGRSAAAVAGIVSLDPTTTPVDLMSAFRRSYVVDGDRHHHVHGANLGVWADVYRAAGGWCPRTVVGEDHALWDAVRAAGRRVVQTSALTVVTSGRVRSRVHGGFATDLSHLVGGVAPTALDASAGVAHCPAA